MLAKVNVYYVVLEYFIHFVYQFSVILSFLDRHSLANCHEHCQSDSKNLYIRVPIQLILGIHKIIVNYTFNRCFTPQKCRDVVNYIFFRYRPFYLYFYIKNLIYKYINKTYSTLLLKRVPKLHIMCSKSVL